MNKTLTLIIFFLATLGGVAGARLSISGQRALCLRSNVDSDILAHGDTSKKQIALTFDDGPHPKYTLDLLKILRENDVRATFFVVGKMAKKYPELLKDEVADGHAIGNHTYHHLNLTKIDDAGVADEIKACGDIVKEITGKTPHLFRPPGGDYDGRVAGIAASLGYNTILWTDDPADYIQPPEDILETRLMRSIGRGGIVLLHDGIQQTLDLLPQFIHTMKARGYQFVTVDEMLRSHRDQLVHLEESHEPRQDARKRVGGRVDQPWKAASP